MITLVPDHWSRGHTGQQWQCGNDGLSGPGVSHILALSFINHALLNIIASTLKPTFLLNFAVLNSFFCSFISRKEGNP